MKEILSTIQPVPCLQPISGSSSTFKFASYDQRHSAISVKAEMPRLGEEETSELVRDDDIPESSLALSEDLV